MPLACSMVWECGLLIHDVETKSIKHGDSELCLELDYSAFKSRHIIHWPNVQQTLEGGAVTLPLISQTWTVEINEWIAHKMLNIKNGLIHKMLLLLEVGLMAKAQHREIFARRNISVLLSSRIRLAEPKVTWDIENACQSAKETSLKDSSVTKRTTILALK